jgi:pyridoxamine 5'-phosphate oxidase
MPFENLEQWLNEEKESGAPNPRQAVLSTVSQHSIPHSRVVAIREITVNGLLFFTQKGTRKVEEMQNNPHASIVFWLELMQRQIIIEGMVEALSNIENENYWRTYSHQAQIRFYAYAPTSGKVISSKQDLEDKRKNIAEKYSNRELPMSPDYCGFRLKPIRFAFYEYRTPELSDVSEYIYQEREWHKKIMSP